jgi:hypothetical protein
MVQTMAGLVYGALDDLSLRLEVARAIPLDDRDDWLAPPDLPQFAALVSYAVVPERLRLEVAAVVLGLRAEQGVVVRGDAAWTVRDGLRASLGYIAYRPGDTLGPVSGLDEHDRLDLGLRWDVQLL